MSSTSKIKKRAAAPALAAVIATVIVGSAAAPAAASPAGAGSTAGGEYRPSEWTQVGGYGASGEAPSLTRAADEPEGSTGSGLLIGVGLVGAGLLGLVAAAVACSRTQPGERGVRRSRGGEDWRRRAQAPATPARP